VGDAEMNLRRLDNFHDVVHCLREGRFVLFPWECADEIRLDRDDWADLFQHGCAEYGLIVEVKPLPRKSVTLVYTVFALPHFSEIEAAIAVLEKRRQEGHEPPTPGRNEQDSARRRHDG
jgi:hypothetical protein